MATDLHTEITSIGTCKTCGQTYRFTGTRYVRNGQVCICGTGLIHFTEQAGRIGQRVCWGVIKATVTETECDDQCRNARSLKCACRCGGEHHAEKFVASIMAGMR